MRKLYSLVVRRYFVLLLVFLLTASSQVKSQIDISIGTGTVGNDNTTYPCPLQDFYEGSRMQFLYLASELQAAGMGPGTINSIKYNVTALATTTIIPPMFEVEQLTVKIGGVAVGTLSSSTWETGTTQVYGPTNYLPVLGMNELLFTTPFFWNGTDNIVIEICGGDPSNTSGNAQYTGNPNIPWTTNIGFNGSHTYRVDNSGNLCSTTTTTQNGGDMTTRPNISFHWTPATACAGTPIGGAAISNKTNVCLNEPFTLSLSGATIGSGLTFQWQSSSNNTTWNNIPGATLASLTTSQSVSSYYRCVVTCTNGGASGNSASVQVTSPALVTGNFTINSGAATGGVNFQTFAEAISHIQCGIGGPVTFTVAPASGPYSEQIIIPQIPGTSAANTITFNCNGASLIFNSTNTNARHGILLNGADYVIIDSLNIDGSAGTYAWGIILTNQADNNIIRKCNVNIGNVGSSSTNYMGIVLNGSTTSTVTSGNNGNGNLFDRNTVNGGYYGMHVYGNSSLNNLNNKFTNNTVLNSYGYGFYVGYQTGTVISNNNISRPSRTNSTTIYAVYLTSGTLGCLVEKNRIHNMFDAFTTSTSSFYGIYVGNSGAAGQEHKIINNLIHTPGGNGTVYGIYNTGSSYMQAYHNTVAFDDASATSTSAAAYGIYQTGTASNLIYRNNIVTVTRSGGGAKRCIYFVTTGSSIVSNNNVLYMNSSSGTNNHVGQFGTTNYTTLANWKTANSGAYDQQSSSTDPLYVNPGSGDYKPTAAVLNDKGANVGITTDINGVVRGASPDPGCYEFDLPACTNPPTPGTAVASVSAICANALFTLDLTGNSVGSTQTYQWQSSPTNAAPWTNVGSAGTSPLLGLSQTSTMYYRAAVTCGAGATVYSTSVMVTANPAFPSGTYTINKAVATGGGNYASFADAVAAISSCGIAGPVTFNVAPNSGPYNEQVVIGQVLNTSTTNTVTFNGNGNSLVYNSTTSANRAGILLNGSDHIIFDSLIVTGSSGTYAWGIVLTNQADSNIVRKCTINIGNLTSTSTNYIGVVLNGSASSTATEGNNGNGNIFDKNTINGGYYGYYVYGSSSNANKNNIFRNSTVLNNYSYSIYLVYQSGAVVSKNNISRPARTTSGTATGVYMSTGTVGCLVEKNRVHHMFDAMPTNTSTFYGVYVGGTGVSGQENKVFNNLIYSPGGNGSVYGIYNSSSPYMQAYHNTIAFDDVAATSGSAYGFYQTGTASNINFRNNLVYITRSGTGTKRALYFGSTGSSIVSNYNLLYLNAAAGTDNHLGQYGTTNFTTFANWKTANSGAYDQLSVNDDPTFTNPAAGDYTPASLSANAAGIALPSVPTDILDAARDASTPDLGAFEFIVLPGTNMRAEALVAPANAASGCYTNAETVSVRIRNGGLATINFATDPVSLTVNITGAVTQTLSTVINTGTLASNATMVVALPSTLDMTTVGTYTFKAYTTVTGDINVANDTMPAVSRIKVAINPGTISVSPPSYCITPGIPTLSTTGGTGYTSIQWQQSTTSGTGFANISGATTSPYTLGSAITQNMYYRLVAGCGTATVNSTEDTAVINNPVITDTTNVSRCGPGIVTLGATANAGSGLNWYTAATGGTPIGSGTSFNTPSLTASTTYYVAASQGGGATQYVGAPNLSIGGTPAVVASYYLNFTVTATTTIQSVDAYFSTVGTPFVVNIRNAATSASVFTYSGTTTVSGTTTPQVIPLNATLNPGNYQIGWTTDPGTYRNNAGGAYPYTIPGVISITGNTFNDANYYYYFYHWAVTTGCESSRIPVIATVKENTVVNVSPGDDSTCLGGNASFGVVAVGSGLNYQWRKDGVDISGATSAFYNITGAISSDAGSYDVIVTGECGADTSGAGTLTIRAETLIAAQPVSQVECPGNTATFTVGATGAGVLSYQWKKGGNVITGATSSTLVISSVTAADAGDYEVTVTGACGSITSTTVSLTLNDVTAITTQPTAQTVCAGGSVTFNVAGTGTGTLTYQWKKNGNDITGATSSSLTINPAAAGDAGDYEVVVTGACGPVTSATVSLTVDPITAITTPPVASTVCEGSPASFTVAAVGAGMTYQWRKNGNNITGATAATYVIPAAALSDAGNYSVVITGTCGSTTSTAVALTVNPTGTWTGAVNNDWNNAGNWCGGLPNATTDAVIPAGSPNMPVLHGGSAIARNITLGTGTSLTLGGATTLEIYGNVTGNGAFNTTAGSLVFRGANSQSVPAFTATNVTLNGNGGAVLNGNAIVTGALTLTNGHITLGSNNLTLSAGSNGSIGSHIITNGTGQVIVSNLSASQTRVIPVAINAASYNPVTLVANAGHVVDNFTVSVKQGVFVNGVSGSLFTDWVVDRTWNINEGTAGGSNVNVTLQWKGSEEFASFERFRSYVMQYSGGAWAPGPETAAAGSDPYTQTKNNVTSFSSFAVQRQVIPAAQTGIFPNPVTGGNMLNIVVRPVKDEVMTLQVYDASGKLMMTTKQSVLRSASLLKLDVSKLLPGMYFLKVSSTFDKEFLVRKFMKAD
jgi:hypothetical protein